MNMELHEAIEHARGAACDGSVRVMKELLIFFRSYKHQNGCEK